MKTAEERAEDIVCDFGDYVGDNIEDHQSTYLTKEIIKALKEQDKITRKACADAIINHDYAISVNNRPVRHLIHKAVASDICLNTKAL